MPEYKKFVLMIEADHPAFQEDPKDAARRMLQLIAEIVHKGDGGHMADLDGKEVATWEFLTAEQWEAITFTTDNMLDRGIVQ